jgi:hypothetical protein
VRNAFVFSSGRSVAGLEVSHGGQHGRERGAYTTMGVGRKKDA